MGPSVVWRTPSAKDSSILIPRMFYLERNAEQQSQLVATTIAHKKEKVSYRLEHGLDKQKKTFSFLRPSSHFV